MRNDVGVHVWRVAAVPDESPVIPPDEIRHVAEAPPCGHRPDQLREDELALAEANAVHVGQLEILAPQCRMVAAHRREHAGREVFDSLQDLPGGVNLRRQRGHGDQLRVEVGHCLLQTPVHAQIKNAYVVIRDRGRHQLQRQRLRHCHQAKADRPGVIVGLNQKNPHSYPLTVARRSAFARRPGRNPPQLHVSCTTPEYRPRRTSARCFRRCLWGFLSDANQ